MNFSATARFFSAMESFPEIERILFQLADLPDRAVVLLNQGAAVELAKRMACRLEVGEVEKESGAEAPAGNAKRNVNDEEDVEGRSTPPCKTILVPSTPIKRKWNAEN